MVHVELIYINLQKEILQFNLSLPAGSTVEDVIKASGIYESNPETQQFAVGLFSKRCSKDKEVKTGDRIEIYRPLQIDPKEKRRERAKKNKN